MSDEPGRPLVSVVIPTRGRPTRLAFALDALAEQTLARSSFEVIVVRDSDDEGSEVEPPPDLGLRYVVGPARGTPAEKRNLGWRAAAASLIAFTDDDCRPAPPWLASLCEAHARSEDGGGLIVRGPVRPDPDESQLLTGLARSLEVDASSRWFPTANVAYERSLIERLGGFDEAFEGPQGEDTDLALRGLAEGARDLFVGEALVWHAVHARTLADAAREGRRGEALALLLARHPRQRQEIFARVFWKRSHATALLAALGLGLARRRRFATAALFIAPFLYHNYDSSKPPTAKHLVATALHMPVRLAIDLVETASTVRGAIRARQLLL